MANRFRFKPNKRGLDQLQHDIQRQLDKRPVTIPIQAEEQVGWSDGTPVINNYHGPVVTVNDGGRAQLAWNNSGQVRQTQTEEITPGYVDLAQAVTDLLAVLDMLGLDGEDAETVEEEARAVLAEVTKAEPDHGVIKRLVNGLRGMLSPIAAGLGKAVTAETAEKAQQAIAALTAGLGG